MSKTDPPSYMACLSPLLDSREPQISQAKRHPVLEAHIHWLHTITIRQTGKLKQSSLDPLRN